MVNSKVFLAKKSAFILKVVVWRDRFGPRCQHDQIHDIPPCQIRIGLQGQGNDAGGDGRGRRRGRMPRGTLVMQVGGGDRMLAPRWITAAVHGGQHRGAFLQVPRLRLLVGGAADRDRVDAVHVAITCAWVAIDSAVAGCPYIYWTQTIPTLRKQTN